MQKEAHVHALGLRRLVFVTSRKESNMLTDEKFSSGMHTQMERIMFNDIFINKILLKCMQKDQK